MIRFCVVSAGLRVSSRANGPEFFCLAYICHAILFFEAEVTAGVLREKSEDRYAIWKYIYLQFHVFMHSPDCFRVSHKEGPGKATGAEINGTHQLLAYARYVNLLAKNTYAVL